ncbi:MAG: hypothetical protein JXA57_19300 [Armatimonadetes bacterium]|nr:hypothetical protein [Armatimonadota bacterium]
MDDARWLLGKLDQALHVLARGRMGMIRTASLQPIHDEIRESSARMLRDAIGATMTELDVDVMEDLMKIVKKLGKGAVRVDNGLEARVKLALELTQMALDRKAPPTPQHLIWMFNEFYKGLEYVMTEEARRAQIAQGGRV